VIRWVIYGGALASGLAFGAGFYVGWKTTLKVLDSVEARKKPVPSGH